MSVGGDAGSQEEVSALGDAVVLLASDVINGAGL